MLSKTQSHDSAMAKPQAAQPAAQNEEMAEQQSDPGTTIRRAGLEPRSLRPQDVLRLQGAVGNREVGRLLAGAGQHQTIQKKENNTGLPDNIKSGIEDLSGMAMDDVRVHYNSSKPAELQGLAYTQGTDIHVGQGQEKHLPHEAWHVVQQKQGRVQPRLEVKGAAINDDPILEQEADTMGAKAFQMGSPYQTNTSLITQRVVPEIQEKKPTRASGEEVAQRLMAGSDFQKTISSSPDVFDHIIVKLNQYQSLGQGQLTHQQNTLANLETKIYTWLEANHGHNDERAIYKLLNDIQQEHIHVIRQVTQAQETPQWMDTSEDQPRDFATLWGQLVNNTGNLKITDQDMAAEFIGHKVATIANFRDQMLSAFARIMSMPKGLSLVRELMNHSVGVTIIPKTRNADTIIRQVGTDESAASPGITSPLPKGIDQTHIAEARTLSSQNTDQYGAIRHNHRDATGAPVGAETLVAMQPGMRDADFQAFNAKGEPIVSPVFVTLAHELQHAEHNVKGHNVRQVRQLGEKNLHYPNLEELDTIEQDKTSENAIREEHNIEKRLGHGGRIVAQRKPVPVNPQKTHIGDNYRDNVGQFDLVKLNNQEGYLYQESNVLFWQGNVYKNLKGEVVDPAHIQNLGMRVLEIAMGELGVIPNNNPHGYTHMRTSNASPCIILTIRYPQKTLMAHIHVGNTNEQIEQLLKSVLDLNTVEVNLITLKRSDMKQDEAKIQSNIYGILLQHFQTMKNISFNATEQEENATIDLATGKINHHKDGAQPQDLSYLSTLRSIRNENRYSKEGSYLFNVRETNSTFTDDEYEVMAAGKSLSQAINGVMGLQLKAAPGASVLQLTRVYNRPTREKWEGFDEDEMYKEFSKYDKALALEEKVGAERFKYMGDTGTTSKANTDFQTREIRIRKDLEVREAALSFGYELTNASQKTDFDDIMTLLTQKGNKADAEEYATRLLKKEARSVLFRSEMAIATGNENLVRNPKYVEIAKQDIEKSEKISAIFTEMKANGMVNAGEKKAWEHYIEQYWLHAKK